MNKLFLVLMLCLATLLGACNSGGGVKKKMTVLEESINQYIFALRWARYQDAHEYHFEEDGSKPPLPLDKLRLIRVTGHTIFEKNVNPELTEATVKGEINYYSSEYGTVQQLPLDQVWWYEKESSRWYLKGTMPNFE